MIRIPNTAKAVKKLGAIASQTIDNLRKIESKSSPIFFYNNIDHAYKAPSVQEQLNVSSECQSLLKHNFYVFLFVVYLL